MEFRATSEDVEITVEPTFNEGQSEPQDGVYVWAYTINIRNNRDTPIKLVNRHWLISNSLGQVIELTGDGVIGEQPEIHPGEEYSYSNFANLSTPCGVMLGCYGVVDRQGKAFSITIPTFSLDSPHYIGYLH